MSETKPYDVFLAHDGEDKDAVEQLARRLVDEAQLKPWLDKWNVAPGESGQAAREEALDSSRTCAVFLGPSGIGPWRNEEMRAALQSRVNKKGFRVIPVLLPGAHTPASLRLPRFLSRLRWIDFNDVQGLKSEEPFRRLVAGIRGHAPGRGDAVRDGSSTRDKNTERRKALYILLTAFFAAAAINLLTEIAQRFLSGGTDRASVVKSFVQLPLYVLQGALALLAGGTLFDSSRERIEKLLLQIGLYKNYGGRKLLLIAIAACGLLLVARLSLPFVAVYYNNWGTQALLKNDLTAAALHYERAIRLNPDYAEAHYSLANIYDRTQRYDEAITEYNRALQLKDQFGQPRNSLARLYLLRGKDRRDFEQALTLIAQELERSPTDELFRYSLYKNLGWANYKLENYPRAEDSLRQAILLRDKGDEDQGAAAHCLLGYVLEAQHKPGAADEWDDCVTFARGQPDVEAVWLEYAKMKLQGGTPQ